MNKSALIYLAIAALALTVAAQPIEWTASSTLAPQGKNRYNVTNLQSTDPSLAWCEGVKGQGIGERVNAKIIASDSAHIKSLVIVNGYAKDQTTWQNNSRIKTLRLYVGGKHLSDLHLSDSIKPQIIQLPESIAVKGDNQLDLSFEIAEVYPGSKFEDACMTSILLDIDNGMNIVDPRDGQIYRAVKIGNDTWMAQNLNFKTEKSKCYDNKERNCAKYGRLYEWAEAKKACPTGWHLPSNSEWRVLISYVGGEVAAGTKLRATSGWKTGGDLKQGTDDFGFSALPCGRSVDGSFDDHNINNKGNWWSSRESYNSAYSHGISHMMAVQHTNYKSHFLSVRCVQDLVEAKAVTPTVTVKQPATIAGNNSKASKDSSITDPRDKQTYRIVKIANDTWMAQNLSFKTDKSKCYKDDEINCAKYGRLYEWDEAKKACPAGWHLPSDAEWDSLIVYAGGQETAETKLKATSGWYYSNNKGTDDFGFSALPGGSYKYSPVSSGFFWSSIDHGYWWSATNYEYNSNYAYYREMNYYRSNNVAQKQHDSKSNLFSVRCVQEAE